MDNKITRSRLSDLLSYEWILMLIIAIASILVWELGYAMGSVILTPGQEFKIYYDSTIVVEDSQGFQVDVINGGAFSYGIEKFGSEQLSDQNYVLADRLSIQEGDVIFTDILGDGEFEEVNGEKVPKMVRAKSLIDAYKFYVGSFDQMIYDAKIYLTKNYFKDGVYDTYVKDKVENKSEMEKMPIDSLETLLEDGKDIEERILNSIVDQKVSAMFKKINKNNNRFREQSEIEQGIKWEKQRIVNLCKNVLYFEDFIKNNPEALFEYTRYEQAEEDVLLNGEKQKNKNRFGKETEIFGINLSKLKNGGELSKVMGLVNPKDPNNVADGIVMMTFDFIKYQPDYQFESLSFACSAMRIYNAEDNN